MTILTRSSREVVREEVRVPSGVPINPRSYKVPTRTIEPPCTLNHTSSTTVAVVAETRAGRDEVAAGVDAECWQVAFDRGYLR